MAEHRPSRLRRAVRTLVWWGASAPAADVNQSAQSVPAASAIAVAPAVTAAPAIAVASPTGPRLLVASEHTKVWFMPGQGSTLVVTFGPLRDRLRGEPIWGLSLFAKLDAPTIGFASTRDHWYPWQDTAALIDRIAEVLGQFERIILYGYSMGAYAAIKFSRRLGAEMVIALSPQFSIAEADVGSFDRRYLAYFSPALHTDMAIKPDDTAGDIYIFLDPAHEIDVLNAGLIAQAGPCRIVPVYFVDHGTIKFISGSGLAQPFFTQVLKGELDFASARRLIRRFRRRSVEYFALLSNHHGRRGRHDRAEAAVRAGLALDEANVGLRLKLAELLLRRGETEAAQQEMATVTREGLGHPGHGARLGSLLKALGRQDEAIALLASVRERWPREVSAWTHSANLFSNLGRRQEAVDYAMVAEALPPLTPQAWRTLAQCWRDLGEIEKSIAAMSAAVAKDPGDGKMRLNLIELLMSAMRFVEAEGEAERLKQFGLQAPSSQRQLAMIWRRLTYLRRLPELWKTVPASTSGD